MGYVQARIEMSNPREPDLQVMGDDVLLGAVPMEDMDLTVHPSRQQLEPDLRSPNILHALVK
ncbi:MAG: hypothetical protein RLZZ255_757 [Cyanobacteriota bacterium]|jgi:hypothetical protein